MIQLSANLGFLWTELTLTQAIEAAANNGFEAVECHFPYTTPTTDVKATLAKTGLQMLGLNTIKGDAANGENGLCALPDRLTEARAAIDQAIHYADKIGTPNVHVMAGVATGRAADKTFIDNLRYATTKAAPLGITILIEPLNSYDAPDYYLNNTAQAANIIETIDADNLKLMFDCYHVQVIEGDVVRRMRNLQSIIGHIQIAAAPDRTEPDNGELDYRYVFEAIDAMGYTQPVGAEYKPVSTTESGLGWMKSLRRY